MLPSILLDFVVGLGCNLAPNFIQGKYDNQKLKERLSVYMSMKEAQNERCSLEEELDFQGLQEYIQIHLQEDAKSLFDEVTPEVRSRARQNILDATYRFCSADTPDAKKRAAYTVNTALEMIRGFYRKRSNYRDAILLSEAVDAVNMHIDSAVAPLVEYTSDFKGALKEIIQNQQNATRFTNDIGTLGSQISHALEQAGTAHPLRPYYGYAYDGKKVVSIPVIPEATTKYPPQIVTEGIFTKSGVPLTGTVEMIMDHAGRHQYSLNYHVTKAKKMLGETVDPCTGEADELLGTDWVLTPGPLSEPVPCRIDLDDVPILNYVELQEVERLDDGQQVISNEKQKDHTITMRFQLPGKKVPDYIGNLSFYSELRTNRESLEYFRLIDQIRLGGTLSIFDLRKNCVKISLNLNPDQQSERSRSPYTDVEFLQRVCDVEDYYHIQISLPDRITQYDLNTLDYISTLVQGREYSNYCNPQTLYYDFDAAKSLIPYLEDEHFEEDCEIPVPATTPYSFLGITVSVCFKRVISGFYCQDVERVRKKITLMEPGETIGITFVPGKAPSMIDRIADSGEQ